MTAFPGMNRLEFSHRGVKITPMFGWEWFADWCVLVSSGVSRPEQQVSIEQKQRTEAGKNTRPLDHIMDIANRGYATMTGDAEKPQKAKQIGLLLNESWEAKRRVSSQITNPHIDALHDRCLSAGSLGGKLCGAGAGGFLLEIVPPDRKGAFLAMMADVPVLRVGMDHYGSTVVFNDGNRA